MTSRFLSVGAMVDSVPKGEQATPHHQWADSMVRWHLFAFLKASPPDQCDAPFLPHLNPC